MLFLPINLLLKSSSNKMVFPKKMKGINRHCYYCVASNVPECKESVLLQNYTST